MHMGFDSSQRSVLEGDGEGCCCWRRFIDLLVSELYTNVGLGVLLDPVVDEEAMEDAPASWHSTTSNASSTVVIRQTFADGD